MVLVRRVRDKLRCVVPRLSGNLYRVGAVGFTDFRSNRNSLFLGLPLHKTFRARLEFLMVIVTIGILFCGAEAV